MITKTGFTFHNIHSSEYNIVCDPSSRILIPERRRTEIQIPGRSGNYMQSDGTYEARKESFHCYFVEQTNVSALSDLARRIAGWLATDGVLEFDNEPGKFYDAYFTGSAPVERHLRYGEFDLEFTYSPPFAYTSQQQIVKAITSEEEYALATVAGTADTPCRIIIRNTGDTTIQNLRITRQLQ